MMGYSIPSKAPMSSLQSAIRVSFSSGAVMRPQHRNAARPGGGANPRPMRRKILLL
jgi:hypothetical protein